MNQDNLYWLFSAAAQSISAFVAFLLTGFALVYSIMNSAKERDETLDEIHYALKIKYHKQLIFLSIITGCAIISSLIMVFINKWEFSLKIYFMVTTAIINLIAIVGGLAFVVSIVNPSRYEKTAKNVLYSKKEDFNLSGKLTISSSFFDKFVQLERLVRNNFSDYDLYTSDKGRLMYSFKQMVDKLYNNEKISRQDHDELMQIIKYRNLVFHGHIDKVDEKMVERIDLIIDKLNNLIQV
ncbi:hypothetical protein KKA87_00230 [bacterium]|nr:hypothetical protein [bacterium]